MFATVLHTLRILPDWLAYGIADLLVPVLVLVTVLTRKRANRKSRGFYYNVGIVFRDTITAKQRRRLLWRWARHMTHLGTDVCKMAGINTANMAHYCDLGDMDKLRHHFGRDQGVIGVTGHIGVFEYSSHLIALSGMPIVTIFRESPIPPVTDVLNKVRTEGGQRLTERSGGVREMVRALRERQVIGIVSDVSSKGSEIFAPFLGTPAATLNTAGMLHLKSGAPMLVITTQRTSRRRYRFRVWDVIEHERGEDREADLQKIANRINDALSTAVCEDLEQWFWDSRRYRTRPVGEIRDAAGRPPQTDPEQACTIQACR